MALTLQQLEQFDPQAPPARGSERRFCCPLPGPCAGKPIDATHRCLNVNTVTGQWNCKRCHEVGILGEFKPMPDPVVYRERATRRVEFPPPEVPSRMSDEWKQELKGLKPLADTAGGEYLAGRGIPLDLAHAAGVRFSPAWFGRPALVFPVRSREGGLVAAAGRYVDGRQPKTRDAGKKSAGCFATPGAWDSDPLILCEGPIDALSLQTARYPSVALLGCSLSDLVAWACALKRVAVALDADEAGDASSAKLLGALQVRGAKPIRLRPPDQKDWNDLLREIGPEPLSRQVAIALATEARMIAQASDSASWGQVDQAQYDAALGEAAAALSDADLISWLNERFGCRLFLDQKGELRAENASTVPGTVRGEIRGRQRLLIARLSIKEQ